MQATNVTVTVMTSVSFVGLLATGYLVGIVLIVLGRLRDQPRVTATGVVVLGLMVLATPLTWYLYQVNYQGGSIRFTATDVLLLGVLAFLGGLVAGLGMWMLLSPTGEPAKR